MTRTFTESNQWLLHVLLSIDALRPAMPRRSARGIYWPRAEDAIFAYVFLSWAKNSKSRARSQRRGKHFQNSKIDSKSMKAV